MIIAVERGKDHPCRPVIFDVIVLEADYKDLFPENPLFHINCTAHTVKKVGGPAHQIFAGFHLPPGYDQSFSLECKCQCFCFKAYGGIGVMGKHHSGILKPADVHHPQRITKVIAQVE